MSEVPPYSSVVAAGIREQGSLKSTGTHPRDLQEGLSQELPGAQREALVEGLRASVSYQSTLDAVYVYEVPWSEFPIIPSYPHYPHPSPRARLAEIGSGRCGTKCIS